MALVLARFLFGFSLSWIAAAVLIAATLLCIRLIGIAVLAFREERSGDIAAALCVSAVVVASLAAIYFLGHRLHDALGASALVGNVPDWLNGDDKLSAAAVFGAMTGFAALAAIPALLNRPRAAVDEAVRKVLPKAQTKAEAKAASAKTPPKNTAAPVQPKGPRVPQLGWTALFLLLVGAALFGFAFSVAPFWPPRDATAAAIQHYQDMATRARPVYLAATALLAAGGLFFLVWLGWRRRA